MPSRPSLTSRLRTPAVLGAFHVSSFKTGKKSPAGSRRRPGTTGAGCRAPGSLCGSGSHGPSPEGRGSGRPKMLLFLWVSPVPERGVLRQGSPHPGAASARRSPPVGGIPRPPRAPPAAERSRGRSCPLRWDRDRTRSGDSGRRAPVEKGVRRRPSKSRRCSPAFLCPFFPLPESEGNKWQGGEQVAEAVPAAPRESCDVRGPRGHQVLAVRPGADSHPSAPPRGWESADSTAPACQGVPKAPEGPAAPAGHVQEDPECPRCCGKAALPQPSVSPARQLRLQQEMAGRSGSCFGVAAAAVLPMHPFTPFFPFRA